MRIALLSNFLPPDEEYGIPRYVYELADALGQRGHSVEVISGCPEPSRDTTDNGNFKTHWVLNGVGTAKFLPAIELVKLSHRIRKTLVALHQAQPFDIVEYPNLTYPGFCTVIQGLPAPSPALVVRLSSPTRNVPRSGLLPYRASELLETIQVRRSDAYIGNTSENLAICKNVYKLSDDVPHTVILHGTPGNISPELHYREPCGNVAFFIGRIEPRKGFDILVKAWELVLEEIPSARLVVAGEDMPWREGDSFWDWSLSQVSSATAENIDYVGFVEPEQKERLYRECDVFTAPSRYESFGLVFLEAMRYGKPVVSCSVGGIPDVVTHGMTGILVPPESTRELADAIVELFVNDGKRRDFGQKSIEDIENRFSQNRVAEETEEFYSSLLKSLSVVTEEL